MDSLHSAGLQFEMDTRPKQQDVYPETKHQKLEN